MSDNLAHSIRTMGLDLYVASDGGASWSKEWYDHAGGRIFENVSNKMESRVDKQDSSKSGLERKNRSSLLTRCFRKCHSL
jgi:hypothetical protein